MPFRAQGVTVHSGHIGNTFWHLRGEANAVAGVLQDGRTATVCGSVAGRGEDGGAVPGVRYLPQGRLQNLQSVRGLWSAGTDRSISTALPARQPLGLPDREADRAAEAGALELGSAQDP